MSTFTLIGGAGFVGRNIAKHLTDQGHRVVVIDSLKSYHNGRIPTDLRHSQLIVKSCSEITPKDVEGSDVVVHLASKIDYWPQYSEYLHNNCEELAKFFEMDCSCFGSFVLFSSQTVYGLNEVPYTTSTRLNPTEQYGLSKYFQERISTLFYKGDLHIIRPTIIVGPGQNGKNLYAGIIKNTVARLNAGIPPMVYSDGEQKRNYVSVFDLARYVENVPYGSMPRLANGASNEGPLTVNRVVSIIQNIMETSIQPIVGEYVRVADLHQRDCVSTCEEPDLFGVAATGEPMRMYVESLLDTDLPTREEIESIDAHNLAMGVIRKAEG